MVDQQLADIKRFLVNSSLHATAEWVEGCVEFFISEHQNERYTQNDLRKFVLDQWKLADLQEMGQGCLLPNLSNIQKTILPGKYAVQVNWIKNVGHSAYSQMQNLRKQANENTEVGTDLPQAWEPKPTRMLQLCLCDGKQTITGMEYRPIRILNEELLPGFKLLIVGPVECRRGVVLLQEHNVQIIGGEIDTLLIPNAIENILARTLNLEPNPDPYKTQPGNGQISSQTALARNNEQPVALFINQNQQIQDSAISSYRDNRNQGSRKAEEELFQEDDLVLENEMDAHLSMLELQFQEELENVNLNEVESDINELEQRYLGEIQNVDINDMEFNSEPVSKEPQRHIPKEAKIEHNVNTNFLDDEDDAFLCQMSYETLEKSSNRSGLPNSSTVTSKPNFTQQSTLPGPSRNTNLLKAKSVKPQTKISNKQVKITSFLNKSREHSDSGIDTACSKPDRSNLGISKKAGIPETKVSHNKSLSSEFVSDLSDWPDDFEISKCNDIEPVSNVKTDKQSPILTDPEPFVYLSQINFPPKCRKVYTVKAFVMTLLSQLTFGKDGWQLQVRLCDGSSNLDVKLSSDALEKLIGFSAVEMRAIRQDVTKNPLLKEKLKNILQNAQQRLINLNSLLMIEFQPDTEMPCVIDIEELGESHLHALKARIDSIYSRLTK